MLQDYFNKLQRANIEQNMDTIKSALIRRLTLDMSLNIKQNKLTDEEKKLATNDRIQAKIELAQSGIREVQ